MSKIIITIILFFSFPIFLYANIETGKLFLNNKQTKCEQKDAMFYIHFIYDTDTKKGKATQYYTDNELFAKYEFKDNSPTMKNGEAYFYANGNITKMQTFKNNKKEGKTEYYKFGKTNEIQTIEYYINDQRSGPMYHPSSASYIDSSSIANGIVIYHQLDSNILVYFKTVNTNDSSFTQLYKGNQLLSETHTWLQPTDKGILFIQKFCDSFNSKNELIQRTVFEAKSKRIFTYSNSTVSSKIIWKDSSEKEAQYEGGLQELVNFLSDNLVYPEQCRQNQIEQEVLVEFVINKNGQLESPKIISYSHSLLNKEAIRVINLMPKWKPGIQNQKPTSSYYSLPINFSLN
jgi:TonB family protein